MRKKTVLQLLFLVALFWSAQGYGAGGGNVDGDIEVIGDGVVKAVDDDEYAGPYDIVDGDDIDIGTLETGAAISAKAVGAIGGESMAYGIYADGGATINSLLGEVTAAGGHAEVSGQNHVRGFASAFGMGIRGGATITDLSGTVTAAGGRAEVSGQESVHGDVSADGMDIWGGATITDLSGRVSATGGRAEVFGQGDAHGDVSADGIKADRLLTIDTLSGNVAGIGGEAEVTGSEGNAAALAEASGMDILEGVMITDLSGRVSATGGRAEAFGQESVYGDVSADGMKVSGFLTIETLSGDVTASGGTAEAASSDAFANAFAETFGVELGVYGTGAVIKNLSGTVSATGGSARASGPYGARVYAPAVGMHVDGFLTVDTLSGDVTASGGIAEAASSEDGAFAYAGAYGVKLGTYDTGTVIKNLSGTVSATGGSAKASGPHGARAYVSAAGMDVDGFLTIETLSGDVTASGGTVEAASSEDDAFAYAEAYGIIIGRGVTITSLSGTVTATGGTVAVTSAVEGYVSADAYGVAAGSEGSISIGSIDDPASGISGKVSATAGEGWDAYAIYAHPEAVESDFIAMSGAGQLIGDVALSGGEDIMFIRDNAVITTVPVLDGGDGKDRLAFAGWAGTFGQSVVNWEQIELNNGTTAALPEPGDEGEPYTMAYEELTIDPTSTLQVSGASPGYCTLIGDVASGGTVSQLDDQDTDDRLTIDGNYAGDTGILEIDVNTGEETSDQVTVTGNATGSTTIVFNELDTPVPLASPIPLVRVEGSASENAFMIDEKEYDYGPKVYRYTLGYDVDDDVTFSLNDMQEGYNEPAALLQSVTPFVERLGYESVMKFHERRTYGWSRNDRGEQETVWVRLTGSKYRLGLEGDAATKLEGHTGWFQAGADIVAGGYEDTRFTMGLFAGAGYGEADVAGLRSGKAGELSQNAYGAGVYMSLHDRGTWYVDVVGQAIWNNLEIDGPANEVHTADNWSWIASLETGGCIKVSPLFRLEPQAQLVYQHTEGTDLSTTIGEVAIHDHEGLQGRLSLAGVGGSCKSAFSPFFEVTLVKDFSGSYEVYYEEGSAELASNPEEWFAGGAIGLSYGELEENNFGCYVKAGALYGVDGRDSYSYSLMAGLRAAF